MTETETDVDILLECLKCQKKDVSGMKRSLIALASIFNSNGESKEYFRRVGGLQHVYSMLFTQLPTSVLQAAVYCLACAVENEVFCQNTLTKPETFRFLHKVFTEKKSQKFVHAAVFLLLNLAAGNSSGQRLAKEASVLQDLLNIFRHCAEKCQINSEERHEELELWSSVVTALSMCVNNPQNDVNQRLCSTILPLCFQVVVEDRWHQLNAAVLSFAALTVAANSFNQNRVRKCGGLDTLVQLVKRFESEIRANVTQIQNAVAVVNVINACITDNEESCRLFVSHGGLQTVIRLLSQPVKLSTQSLLQLVLTLGHALEHINRKSTPITSGEQKVLVQLLMETDDEEVVRATKYVLNLLQNQETEEDDEECEDTSTELVATTQRIKNLSSKLRLMDQDTECIDSHSVHNDPESEGDARVPVYKYQSSDDLQVPPQTSSWLPPAPLQPASLSCPQKQIQQRTVVPASAHQYHFPSTQQASGYPDPWASSAISSTVQQQSFPPPPINTSQGQVAHAFQLRPMSSAIQPQIQTSASQLHQTSQLPCLNLNFAAASTASQQQRLVPQDALSKPPLQFPQLQASRAFPETQNLPLSGPTGQMPLTQGHLFSSVPHAIQPSLQPLSECNLIPALTVSQWPQPQQQCAAQSAKGTASEARSYTHLPPWFTVPSSNTANQASSTQTQPFADVRQMQRSSFQPTSKFHHAATSATPQQQQPPQHFVSSQLPSQSAQFVTSEAPPHILPSSQYDLAPQIPGTVLHSAQVSTPETLQPSLQRGSPLMQAETVSVPECATAHSPTGSCEAEERQEWMAFQYFKKFVSSFVGFNSSVQKNEVGEASEKSHGMVLETAGLADCDGGRCREIRSTVSMQGHQMDCGDGQTHNICSAAGVSGQGSEASFHDNVHTVQSDHTLVNLPPEQRNHPADFNCTHDFSEPSVRQDPDLESATSALICQQGNKASGDVGQSQKCCDRMSGKCVADYCAEHSQSAPSSTHPSCLGHISKTTSCSACFCSQSYMQNQHTQGMCTRYPLLEMHNTNVCPRTGFHHPDAEIALDEKNPPLIRRNSSQNRETSFQGDENFPQDDKTLKNPRNTPCDKDLPCGNSAVCASHNNRHISGTCSSDGARSTVLQQDVLDSEFRVPFPKEPVTRLPKSTHHAHGYTEQITEHAVKPLGGTSFSSHTPIRKGLRRAPTRTPIYQHACHDQRQTVHTSTPTQKAISSREELSVTTWKRRLSSEQDCKSLDSTPKALPRSCSTTLSGNRSSVKQCLNFASLKHDLSSLVPPSPAASEFDCKLLKAASSSSAFVREKHFKSAAETPRGTETHRLYDCAGSKTPVVTGLKTPVVMLRRLPETPNQVPKERFCEVTKRRQPEQLPHDSGCGGIEEVIPCSDVSDDENENSGLLSLRVSDENSASSGTGTLSETSSSVSEVYSLLKDSPHEMHELSKNSKDQNLCSGCSSREPLNSRTFNIALETSAETCSAHRIIRQVERDFILSRASKLRLQTRLGYQQWKDKLWGHSSDEKVRHDWKSEAKIKKSSDVYDFSSSGSDRQNVSPPRYKSTPIPAYKSAASRKGGSKKRRHRVPYTEEEECNLVEGVRRLGKHWTQLLNTFSFHPSRTSVDLMEKYKRMQKYAKARKDSQHSKKSALSMCEERRLQRGVARLGHNWTAILQSGRFALGRTAKELRDKWRTMSREM